MNLGLYIQVPFCQSKCTYCNFHTGVFPESLQHPYVAAVCREIHEHAALYAAQNLGTPAADGELLSVDTVYVGGGTPSLLPAASLAQIMDALRGSFRCVLEEVTLEVDPETVSPEKARAWRFSGFNRISLGAQSFQDAELKITGRRHRRDDIYTSVATLRAAGFSLLSLDLILGLPLQTRESFDDSVQRLLALRPEHISIYMLEVDEASRLGREVIAGGGRCGAASVPSDDAIADSFDAASAQLAAAGYEHYEISNWALPGCRARHNSKYWRRAPYLGFGAGAHSFNRVERWANAHDPAAYSAALAAGRLPIEQRYCITREQALEEEIFLGLRMLDGIDLPRIEAEYGVNFRARLPRVLEARAVEFDGLTLRLVPSRLAVSSEVIGELLT
jgi:oxygen-independent coproporphyrinogen III oxidase